MEKKRESRALGIRVACLAREVSKQVRDNRQPYGEAEMGLSVSKRSASTREKMLRLWTKKEKGGGSHTFLN